MSDWNMTQASATPQLQGRGIRPGETGVSAETSGHSWKRMRTSDRVALAAAAAAALGAMGASASGALAGEQTQADTHAAAAGVEAVSVCDQPSPARVKIHNVQGRFWYSQDVVTPTERVMRDLCGTSTLLCADVGAAPSPDEIRVARMAEATPDALDTVLSVSGLVAHPLTSTLRDLADSALTTRLMAYTCADNPADGRATANAEVTGIDLDRVLDIAQVSSRANVIRFVSADGYSTRVPLDYVAARGAVVVCRINGSPISQVVGSSNQLWIGATAARYDVRDLCEVVLEHASQRDMPPTPGTAQANDGYLNRPNVGALSGRFA